MNNNVKVILLNLQKVNFSNKETGQVTTMCKITYGLDLTKTDNFVGYSVLESYAKESAFAGLEKVLKRECMAVMEYKPTQNGVKYVITKINDTPVK